MSKRPRLLLGLWALFGRHGAPVKGFAFPAKSRAQLRIRQLHEKKLVSFKHPHHRQVTASPCTVDGIVFAESNDDEGQGESFVSNGRLQGVTNDSVKKGAAPCPPVDDRAKITFRNLPLSQLLNELDKRDIRYSPSANRSELERMLLQDTQHAPLSKDSSLQELLDELDHRDIRYPPTASRNELHALLASTNDSAHTTRLFVDGNEEKRTDHSTIPVGGKEGKRTDHSTSPAGLLKELDRRNIPYPPEASRQQLEILLQQSTPPSLQRAKSISESPMPPITLQSSSSTSTSRDNDRSMGKFAAETSVERTQSQPASALKSDKRRGSSFVDATTENRTTQSNSPAKLQKELDRRNIRYSPRASRQQLEVLLQQSTPPILERPTNVTKSPTTPIALDSSSSKSISRDNDKGMDALTAETSVRMAQSQPPSALESRDKRRGSRRMPLNVLLAELDRLNIRYEPTASRAQLEGLYKEASTEAKFREVRRQQRRLDTVGSSGESVRPIKDLLRKSTLVAAKSVQKLPRKVSRIAASSAVTSRMSSVAERAARQARRVSRRAADFWNEDEDGVRDVRFEYISIDRPIDVPAVRLDEDEPLTASRPPKRRRVPRGSKTRSSVGQRAPSSNWQSEDGIPIPFRRDSHSGQSVRSTPKRRQQKRPASRNAADGSPDPFLVFPSDSPPIPRSTSTKSNTASQNQSVPNKPNTTVSQTQNHHVGQNSSKRTKQIYSPYVVDKDGEIEGPFDRIGDFLATSADKLLWGPIEESNGDAQEQSYKRSNDDTLPKQGDNGKKIPRGDGDREEERKPRYWKDRLAEHVDFALGIHEDGEYYNSWEKQLANDNARREREGPQFWEQNSPKKTRGQRQSRQKAKYAVPFWEEDGSIVSFILGRTKSGEKLGMERLIERTSGDNRMVTTFFKSALRASLLVSAYICRWASVRGAIPQPIVVIGTIASFLSARPRYRLRAVLVALVAMRTVGELVHGYIYGDADWEDDSRDTDDEDSQQES